MPDMPGVPHSWSISRYLRYSVRSPSMRKCKAPAQDRSKITATNLSRKTGRGTGTG